MAINPVSDLVMDVARAADPQAYRAASERLKSLSAVADTKVGFSSYADRFNAGAKAEPPTQDPANSAYRKFEAFMLQSFVQSMFTSDASTTFGKGIAGEYWKSMMSEAMANKMADSGGVGIARLLEEQATRKAQLEPASALAIAGNSVANDLVHGFERQHIQWQLNNNDRKDSASS
ncbi:rod-binding protein [Ochrobactrum sp. S1502_03]|uniref:rod-binding protein n=1 Tax=Ochrobactrum sp. S1502_03 TaxID=3108451 RepID=UPI0037C54A45